MTGTNTYSGGTTVSAGTLQIGGGGTSGSIYNNVTDNAALIFNLSSAYTMSGIISGTGSLTQAGSGTLILTNTNTYSGVTTVSAGTLQIGAGWAGGSISGNVTDNAALAFDRTDAYTSPYAFSGAISGTGSLTQAGSGADTKRRKQLRWRNDDRQRLPGVWLDVRHSRHGQYHNQCRRRFGWPRSLHNRPRLAQQRLYQHEFRWHTGADGQQSGKHQYGVSL